MAAQHPTAPPLQHVAPFCDTNDVPHAITQLPIGDSFPITSNQLAFSPRFKANSTNGTQLFPLGQCTTNYIQNISGHNLHNYLRSQRIVKNIQILKIGKNQQTISNYTQQFPLKEKQLIKFPFKNETINEAKFELKNKEMTFYAGQIFHIKVSKRKQRHHLNVERFKGHQNTYKCRRFLRVKLHLRTLLNNNKHCKNLFCLSTLNLQANKQLLIKYRSKQFPVKLLLKTDTEFPLVNEWNTKLLDFKQTLKTKEICKSQKINKKNVYSNWISSTKFPCQTFAAITKFPINQNVFHNEHSLSNDPANSGSKVHISKTAHMKNSSPSCSMPQIVPKLKHFDNEHVLQVQDTPTEAMENPQSFKMFENNKQTPSHSTPSKGNHDDDDDDDDDNHEDIHKLADTNSINNARPNEVGYYAEKIEHLQSAIVSLFEKIQNSLITNHNRDHHGSSTTNAQTQHDEHGIKSNTSRFALTPPMSVTSVQNSESINNDNTEVAYEKFDLAELCVGGGGGGGGGGGSGDHIVECSDVRETLTEAVECGKTKEQIDSTVSILVKSEEPTSSLCTLDPRKSLNETDDTSLAYKSNLGELLSPKSTEIIENLKSELITQKIDISDTVESEFAKSALNEMTVTRSNKHEQAKTSQLKTNKTPEHKNDNLSHNKDSNEMKYEMHKIKPDTLKPAATSSQQRLPISSDSPRNYNDSSFTLRSQMKHETPSSAAVRRASLHPPLSQDLNDKPSKRTSLNVNKTSTASNVEQTMQRRASLGAVRNAQHTSQLSVDLPRYNPLAATKQANNTEQNLQRRSSLGATRSVQSTTQLSNDLARYTPLSTAQQADKPILSSRAASSMDSSLADVLPERTRLRRQRRLRAQGSQEEPESAVERLNRLRARISASLSEVKGVLKQYSTEAETENENEFPISASLNTAEKTNANENQTSSSLATVKEVNEDDAKEGPVVFRFVKKVRRRSLFTEDDEKESKPENEPNKDLPTAAPLQRTDETDHCKEQSEKTFSNESITSQRFEAKESPREPSETSADIKKTFQTNHPTSTEEKQETVEGKDQTDHCQLHAKSCNLNQICKEQVDEQLYEANYDNTTCHTMKPGYQEVSEKPAEPTTQEDESRNKGAISKLTMFPEQTKAVNDTSEGHKKLKKKIVLKTKDALRRASLAAVEGSKIEPPVGLAVPNKIQRRPSDSEAVVKKKSLTAKTNTSGAVEEVTPKPKIVKVKKSSLKSHNNNNNNTQLATLQTKLQDEADDFALTTTNVKSNEHNEWPDKDNQSIVSDKNQDVLVPKAADLENQQKQLKNEITRQANSWLPTQSVIDEAASSNENTIENSVLTPRQQQQQQQQQQQSSEQNLKATIKSTATKFTPNVLQAKGAMLENVTAVTSSSTASEANGQKTRENVVPPPPADYHDLLQTEIAFSKPSTTKISNNSQLCDKVEIATQPQQQSSHENLDKYQKQQTATQNQQVLKTTDNDNKHDNLKATATLKEPCKESATTSSHVEVVQQQKRGADEQPATNDTKTVSSPHNSISCTSDITAQTTTKSTLSPSSSPDAVEDKKAEASVTQADKMPELQLAPAPVQTADIISQPDHHKKKIIIKKIVRQTCVDKSKNTETKSLPEPQPQTNEPASNQKKQPVPELQNIVSETPKSLTPEQEPPVEQPEQPPSQEDVPEECSESTELSESSTSQGAEEVPSATDAPRKERIVKKKVIIKRQKRRLSIGENFFHPGSDEQSQNAEIETLEKPIAFVSDDEAEHSDDKDREAQADPEQAEETKPLRSCILRKEYNIGDEVLYAERFKKTQIKWRRGRIKERITSISYLLDIDGKDVSSHINYLKKFTGRKVSFGGKEYLEIDYEQLAEEEEKAERLQKRSYSIWNMV